MSDLTLSSRWSITLHDPSSHLPCSIFGQFGTIFEFWRLFNLLIDQDLINTLPTGVNITIYRENIKNKLKNMKEYHGEWNIELHHKTNPTKIYQNIILLVIGEQLTNKIRSIVLQRIPAENNKLNFSVSIFSDMRNPRLNVKNILLSNNVIDINHCVQKMAIFHPFQIIHVGKVGNAEHNNINADCDEYKQSEQEYMANSKDIPCIKYSMESLLVYSKLIQQRTNKMQQNINNNNKEQKEQKDVVTPYQPKEQLLDFRYREFVVKLFGKYMNSYHLRVINNDDILSDKFDEILTVEGCVICRQTVMASPYNENHGRCVGRKGKTGVIMKEEKEMEMESDDASKYAFIIATCPELGCQHIIHCQCIVNANDHIIMRDKHCPYFFKTVDLSKLSNKAIQKEIGYHIDTNYPTDKSYHFSFKINHLISNQNSISPQWPIRVVSYYQLNEDRNNEKEECLQIFFENTELPICRGTIQVAIVSDPGHKDNDGNDEGNEAKTNVESISHDIHNINDIAKLTNNYAGNGGNIFMHNANFEIPSPGKIQHDFPKLTNKIYQLRYIDPISKNTLIINVNMKLKPNFALQLLSLRYEFNPNFDPTQNTQNDHEPTNTVIMRPLQTSKSADIEEVASTDCISEVSGATKFIESLPLGSIITIPSENGDEASHHHNNQQHHEIQTNHTLYTNDRFPVNMPGATPTPSIGSYLSPSPSPRLHAVVPRIPPLQTHLSVPVNSVPFSFSPPFSFQLQIPIELNNINDVNLYNNATELHHYACTDLGSNYICTKIKNPVYYTIFFEKLSKFFSLLMINSTGHTVCRAIYSQSHCTLTDKLVLLKSLIPSFASIASNRQGSFALICIMSLMTTNEEIQVLTKAFVACISNTSNNSKQSEFDEIILSQSGYHVIKKYIAFGFPHFNCILSGISSDFTKYATHHYGVPIIRSILDMMSVNDDLIYKYQHCLQLFAQHTHSLICNQYGNYVIQQLLEISPQNVTDTIKEFMLTKYSEYSQHKFASNVVEKCLKHTLREIVREREDNEDDDEEDEVKEEGGGDNESFAAAEDKKSKKGKKGKDNEQRRNWIRVIVFELLSDAAMLINHKYGNYCLQTALSVVMELVDLDDDNDGDNDHRLLLQDFINTTYPILHLLRLNVRKKWQQLLSSATDKT